MQTIRALTKTMHKSKGSKSSSYIAKLDANLTISAACTTTKVKSCGEIIIVIINNKE